MMICVGFRLTMDTPKAWFFNLYKPPSPGLGSVGLKQRNIYSAYAKQQKGSTGRGGSRQRPSVLLLGCWTLWGPITHPTLSCNKFATIITFHDMP